MPCGGFQDLFFFHHDAQVDNFEAVAAQYEAHDILADVVNIALDRGLYDHGAGMMIRFARKLVFHIRFQHRYGVFHYPGGFDHLREEHLSGAELFADLFHAGHERALDDADGRSQDLQAAQHVARQVGRLTGNHVVAEPLFRGACVGHLVDGRGLVFLLQVFCRHGGQSFSCFPVAGQDHIFHGCPQFRVDGVVGLELGGVDDGHVESRPDGMIKEDRVHGRPDRFVSAEGEREV